VWRENKQPSPDSPVESLERMTGRVDLEARCGRGSPPPVWLRLTLRWAGGLVSVSSWLYCAMLLAVWLLLSHVGERNIFTAFLLYLPPSIWFLPALALLPLSLPLAPRAAGGLVVVIIFLLGGWLDFRPGRSDWAAPPDGEVLVVLTYNRGQQGATSLQPFKNLAQPDVMVMQDAGNRAERYLHSDGYTEFSHAASAGEHTLVSRHPILEAEARGERAARFVIEWRGRRVAIYSVHLFTPRGPLQSLKGGGFLHGLPAIPGSGWEAKRRQKQEFWDGQLADAREIMSMVRADALPAVVAGDFNAPSVGLLYRLLAAEWTDAHASAGRGFGMTFPGETRNPLSAGGPWLRIDYIFAGDGWEVAACITEESRPSQHRAVAARLQLRAGWGEGRRGGEAGD
jgi:vancomycin resistance protein VanJ